ncbi:uncharacterized protein LOC130674474 isoform X1 [Microplitis mediator]|uniref:uncharacterized protein LOC130674474 isoform X1 n=1 Tax=Microplitis mediator TaxID=375433 RepID=UPI0025575A05|nr:uncharacterized protein LOC130674474 isoform X1 [Microplitis mediator]
MECNKIILFYYCLFIVNVSCSNIKINASSPEDNPSNRLISDAREIVEKWFTNNSNPIIMSTDLINDDHEVKISSDIININSSLIIINEDFKPTIIEGYIPAYPTYVLLFKSFLKLTTLIGELRKSKIWSIKSPFFVLDTTKDPLCMNAQPVLGMLWEFDLLSAYYLCYNNDRDSTIVYTLNPFTNFAPSQWAPVDASDVFVHKPEEKWTFYSLKYSKGKKIYENKISDKTKNLDRYKIKIISVKRFPNVTLEKKVEMQKNYMKYLTNNKSTTLYSLIPYINATYSVYFLELGFSTEMMIDGYIDELVRKKYDTHDKLTQLADTNYQFTDIITQYTIIEFSILTRKSNYLTSISEITYNIQFIILSMVFLFLILAVILINNTFRISESIMDMVRMLANMGVMSPMDRLSMRIIYFSGFLFIFIIMPEFQGQISAMLSKPIRRNVESLRDLRENKYHVYFDALLLNDMINEKLWVTDEDRKYMHPTSNEDLGRCAYKAQENSTIACIDRTMYQLDYALNLKNLYVSKDVVFRKYLVYWTRKDWPLKDRVDKIAALSVETGLVNYWNDKPKKEYSKKLKKINKIKENEKYEQIDFDNLVFSYMFTGVILLWGVFIFAIELLFHKYSKLRKQVLIRRRFGNRKSLRSQPRIVFFPGRMVLLNSRK